MSARRVLEMRIPGPTVSGNASFRFSASGKRYTSSEALQYKDRVRSIAFSEIQRQKWTAPEYAGVCIVAYNSRLDCGNIEKLTCDAMQGTAIRNDRYNT